MSLDDLGCTVAVIAITAGGLYAFRNYEIREKVAVPPVALASLPPARPTGMIRVAYSDKDTWLLNADAVSGPRNARQGWVTVTTKGKKSYSQTLYRTDCATTATVAVSWAEYDAAGKNSRHGGAAKDEQPSYYPPSSMGHQVVKEMCKEAYGK